MHLILQTGSQLHAHRLHLYASSPRLQAFPSAMGFCTSAEELGTRESDHRGPCLVLLSNFKVSPEDLNHHIRSTFLRGYIVRVYWYEHTVFSRADLISHLDALINKLNWSWNQVATWAISGRYGNEEGDVDKPSVAEVYATTEVGLQQISISETVGCTDEKHFAGAPDEPLNLIEMDKFKFKLKLRLQTYPRGLAESLVDDLGEVDFQPHGFSHSLYVVDVDGTYRYGLGSGKHMYLAPCDREDLAKGSISRASLKLEETLQVLGFHLHQDMIAMDLGASPGAWTQFLSKHISQVVAVDPAPLHKRVLLPNVTHISKMAQDAREELAGLSHGKGFDMLVCDINRHPVEAAQIVSPLLAHLRKGGLLVLTLKFHGRGRDKDCKVDEIKGIFQDSLTNMDCIWLLANSIYERTFVGIKI